MLALPLPVGVARSTAATQTSAVVQILSQTKRSGSIAPRQFVRTVQHANVDFHSPMHQDAQELLSFLLNRVSENMRDLDEELGTPTSQPATPSAGSPTSNGAASNDAAAPDNGRTADSSAAAAGAASHSQTNGATAGREDCPHPSAAPPAAAAAAAAVGASGIRSHSPQRREGARTTLIESVFVGHTVTNTMCMNCEKVSRKKEDFKELKVEMDNADTTLERCMLASRCAPASLLQSGIAACG